MTDDDEEIVADEPTPPHSPKEDHPCDRLKT